MKNIDKNSVKKILVITLSNIGDVILTLPVFFVLKREFPGAEIHAMSGERSREILANDLRIKKIIIYDKKASFVKQLRLGLKLRSERYDLVVDLRNTAYPLIIGAKYRTSVMHSSLKPMHKKDVHLLGLARLGINTENAGFSLAMDKDSYSAAGRILLRAGLSDSNPYIVFAPGGRSHIKRWRAEGFADAADRLITNHNFQAVFAGDAEDAEISDKIRSLMKNKSIDLCGKTNITQLAAVISRASLLITNDSAALHVGSAFDIPTVAIFGPTDPLKYGPLSSKRAVVRKKLECLPCESAVCEKDIECMKSLDADEVYNAAKGLL